MTMQLRDDKRCDLCDGTQFELISEHDRDGQDLQTDLCTTCGLVSHRDIPSDEELDTFYAMEYRQLYHGELIPSSRRVMRAWKNGERLVRQLSPLVDADAEVMEVGAGIGCTVKAFQQQGWDARGIEPHHGFQTYAQRSLHANVTGGYVFDLPRTPSSDLVLLIHVIEHFRSPRAALEHLHSVVRPGGRLYVECPNLGAPFATRGRMFHFAHIHNFTPDTLTAMGRRCGFELERTFGRPAGSNLQLLFRRVGTGQLEIDPQSYHRTHEALERYNALTYHLRWRYMRSRVTKLAGYLEEHLLAKRYVPKLLSQISPVREEFKNNVRRAA